MKRKFATVYTGNKKERVELDSDGKIPGSKKEKPKRPLTPGAPGDPKKD